MPRDAQELIGDIQVCTEIPPVHVPRIKRRMVAISNPDTKQTGNAVMSISLLSLALPPTVW